MDIEGDEWPVLDTADPRHLRRFTQLVCEFHGFQRAGEQAWHDRIMRVMEKLLEDFAVVHVHGNNATQFAIVGNVPFPDVLEVTFAARSRYGFTACDDLFPTPLDQPNVPHNADLFLGRFKF